MAEPVGVASTEVPPVVVPTAWVSSINASRGTCNALINHPKPFLLCYSGDTRPSSELIKACQFYSRLYGRCGIDLLLHEATFADTEIVMCVQKKHSTVTEALGVAAQVGADRTLLTHFSQRYNSCTNLSSSLSPRLSAYASSPSTSPSSGERVGPRVMAAMDGLRIKLFEIACDWH